MGFSKALKGALLLDHVLDVGVMELVYWIKPLTFGLKYRLNSHQITQELTEMGSWSRSTDVIKFLTAPLLPVDLLPFIPAKGLAWCLPE